jgi:hypothetical protein
MATTDFLDELWALLKTDTFVDCTLHTLVGDKLELKTYQAHKVVLASQSSHFRQTLTNRSTIDLPADPDNIFPHILRFLYGKYLDIPLHKVMSIILYCQYLKLESLSSYLQTKLCELPSNPFHLDLVKEAAQKQVPPEAISILLHHTVHLLGQTVFTLPSQVFCYVSLPTSYLYNILKILKGSIGPKSILFYLLKYLNSNSKKVTKSTKDIKELFAQVEFDKLPWDILETCLEDPWIPKSMVYQAMCKNYLPHREVNEETKGEQDTINQGIQSSREARRPLRLASLGYRRQKELANPRPHALKRSVSDSCLGEMDSMFHATDIDSLASPLLDSFHFDTYLKNSPIPSPTSPCDKDVKTESESSPHLSNKTKNIQNVDFLKVFDDYKKIKPRIQSAFGKNPPSDLFSKFGDERAATIKRSYLSAHIRKKNLSGPSRVLSLLETDVECTEDNDRNSYDTGSIPVPHEATEQVPKAPPNDASNDNIILNPFVSHLPTLERPERISSKQPGGSSKDELNYIPCLDSFVLSSGPLDGMKLKNLANKPTQFKNESLIVENNQTPVIVEVVNRISRYISGIHLTSAGLLTCLTAKKPKTLSRTRVDEADLGLNLNRHPS